jgi:hypothetical protein
MEQFDREFRILLRSHNFKDINAHSGTAYGVWENFRLAYLNPAWFQFAKENKGEPNISAEWGLGTSILDCVSGDVRELYEAKFNQSLDSHEIWNHEYECSSETVYRRYHQIVYPMGQREGLLIVNSLVAERPHDKEQRSTRDADESHYVDQSGLICQCAYCRRVKNFREIERWDWVSEWVRRCPENTSHTWCPTCAQHYFPQPTTDK